MIADRIRDNLENVRGRIAAAEQRSGREAGSVRLLCVTKRTPPEWARALVALGACDLGENYPQELWKKSEALADLGESVCWHLIGHLQTNKLKRTLPLATMVHAVDSLRLLRALNDAAAGRAAPTDERWPLAAVCLQVNTSDEPNKHGWAPVQILEDAEAIAEQRALPIAGLMTMAALGTTAETSRRSFVKLREVRDELRRRTGMDWNELSMGMSNDFETAIEEGATWVRVGSALFEGTET